MQVVRKFIVVNQRVRGTKCFLNLQEMLQEGGTSTVRVPHTLETSQMGGVSDTCSTKVHSQVPIFMPSQQVIQKVFQFLTHNFLNVFLMDLLEFLKNPQKTSILNLKNQTNQGVQSQYKFWVLVNTHESCLQYLLENILKHINVSIIYLGQNYQDYADIKFLLSFQFSS